MDFKAFWLRIVEAAWLIKGDPHLPSPELWVKGSYQWAILQTKLAHKKLPTVEKLGKVRHPDPVYPWAHKEYFGDSLTSYDTETDVWGKDRVTGCELMSRKWEYWDGEEWVKK